MIRKIAGYLLIFGPLCLFAQQPTPLLSLLSKLEQEENIRFVYDTELLSQVIIKENREISTFTSLAQVINELPLELTEITTGTYSITTKKASYHIDAADSLGDQPVTELTVLVNNQPIPVTSSTSGWSFNYEPKLQDLVSIFSLGFESYQLTYSQLLNAVSLKILLKPKFVELSGVTIEDYIIKGINMDPTSQSIKINTENLPLLPGETDGDLFASISALPGISSPDTRPGNLYIRGSSTDQSLILYNDIPIYHRGHYFGTISPYNQKIVKSVKVYRNGFQANMGGRVGGAVEINSEYSPQNDLSFGLGSNTLYSLGYLKYPAKSQKWGLSVGARRSYPYSLGSPKLTAISDMVFAGTALADSAGISDNLWILFEDYSANLVIKPNKKHQITATSLYTNSQINFDLEEDKSINQIENLGANIQWKYHLNQRQENKLSITSSSYNFNFHSAPITDPDMYLTQSVNQITDLGVKEEFNLTLPSGNTLLIGANYAFQKTNYDYVDSTNMQQGPYQNSGSNQSHTISPFANYEWKNHPKLYVQFGLRGNYYSLLQNFRLAPRLFTNYYPTDHITVKGSAGLYHQYLSQVKTLEFVNGGFDNELWMMADNEKSKIIDGNQEMIGFIYSKKSFIFDVEFYQKKASNISYYSEGRFSTIGYYYFAQHESRGLDLLIKKSFGDDLTLWAAYSWSENKIRLDSAQERTYLAPYGQPDNFSIGANYVKGNFKVSLGWKYASGQFSRTFRIIKAEKNYYNFVNSIPPRAPKPRNDFKDLPERYEAFHSLDLSASYTLPKSPKRDWSSSLGISLINIYNHVNVIDNVVRAGKPTAILAPRYAMGFAPNIMLMVEW